MPILAGIGFQKNKIERILQKTTTVGTFKKIKIKTCFILVMLAFAWLLF